MSTSKRTYKDVDPDYTDACEQQTKRQKELEQDAKQNVGRRIQGIVRNEFRKEINNKELELHQVDRRLNEARLMMDRLRACIISTYYGQINQSGTSEVSRMNGPPSSIHPAVKKHLGKRPSHNDLSSALTVCHTQPSSRQELSFNNVSDCMESVHQRSVSRQEQQNKISVRSPVYQSPASAAACNTSHLGAHGVTFAETTYDDRWARFKIKKKIIIGNVSKYIPVDHREANDKSSHKWMVYVRGPKLEPNISGFVKKVWFFLHHSYKPNDLVEISCPPFHLTRRGWGEFPVRVQLHFVDPRNKKVDIIHQLKLDKTFSGLQTLGTETTVELDLEKDFFEPDTHNCSSYMRPTSGGSSTYQESQLSSSSCLNAAKIGSSYQFTCSQNEETSSEHSQMDLSNELEADNTDSVLDASSGVQSTDDKHDNHLIEVCDMHQPACEVEIESVDLKNNSQSLEEYNMTIVHDIEECTVNRQKEENMVATDMAVVLKAEQENTTMTSSVIPNMHTCVSASLMKGQPTLSSVTTSTKAALIVINRPQWINPDNSYTSYKSGCHPRNLQIAQPSELARHHSGTTRKLTILSPASKVDNLSEVVSVSSTQQSSTVSSTQQSSTISSTQQSSTISATQQSSTVSATQQSSTISSTQQSSTVSSTQQSSTISSTPQISKTAQKVQSGSYILMTPNELCVNPTSLLPLSLSALPISSIAQVVGAPTSCSGLSSAHMSFPLTQNVAVNACTTDNTQSDVPCMLPLSQQVNQVKENQSPYSSDIQKVIIKSKTMSFVPELANTNTPGIESKLLQQPKPSGPRQVSLLTGRVFSPQASPSNFTKISLASHGSNESLLASNCAMIKQSSDQTTALGNSAHQITQCVSKAGVQMLHLNTVNHPSLSVPQSADNLVSHSLTLTNQITNVNGLMMPGLTSQLDSVSIVNAEGSAENLPLPVSLLSNSVAGNTLNILASHNKQADMRRTNVVLHVPGQDQSHLINGQNYIANPKMSAIGMTKFGKNSASVLTANINLKSTTDEERKRNQYEVLMAWKRNCHLNEKAKQAAKIPKDRIEGEADIIPELNLDDYMSMRALVKAAVKLHPLVQAGINKLTHPYCAESVEEWMTWTFGKQLASEWHRACFVLKYLKSLLGISVGFRGEQLMTTRQLVRWCRLHAFSPLAAVVKAKPEDANDDRDSHLLQNKCPNPSFTPADTLEIDMLAEVAVCGQEVSNGCDDDVLDIVDTEDADRTRKLTNRIPELDDENMTQEVLPPSDEALFVFDELRKRGVIFQPNELQPGVMSYTAADMLYKAMQEFLADVLRETVAVSAVHTSHSSAAEITRRDVHQALTQLPEAAFSCNKFLGKADVANDGSGR